MTDEWFLSKILQVLSLFFCSNDQTIIIVQDIVRQVLSQGEETKYVYKVKQNKNMKAEVCLQLLDSGLYSPTLIISDSNGNFIAERVLEMMNVVDMPFHFGSIHLSKSEVVIKPRNNVFTKDWESIHVPFSE